MYQKKTTITRNQDKRILEGILSLIENYFPQKKKRYSYSEFRLDKFESFIIKYIRKHTSKGYKSLERNLSSTKIIFTIGSWALPYLNLLKRVKLLK